MHTRRRALLMAAAGVTALSGCSSDAAEFATGDGPLEREADRAALSQSALSQTEYELTEETERTIRREVSASGQTREIIASNKLTRYAKAIDISDRGSLFGVISSPGFVFAGRTLNPIAKYSNRELLGVAGQEFNNLSVRSVAEENQTTVLGKETTVSKFDATATFANQRYEVYIHVGMVADKGDIIIGLGGYPQAYDDTEDETVSGFFNEIQHPV